MWRNSVFSAASAVLAASPAAAASILLIDRQGGTPDRTAIYAEPVAIDLTPITMELLTAQPIKQINVTMVFEAAKQPYWTQMALQFKCPIPAADKRRRSKPAPVSATTGTDPVMFRMESGNTRSKNAAGITKLNPTAWQESSSYSMQRLQRLACHDNYVYEAINSSFDPTGEFNYVNFEPKMKSIGLNDTIVLSGGLFMGFLADFTWKNLWPDVKKPVISSDRKLTPQEVADWDRKFEQDKRRMATQKAEVMASLKQMEQKFAFRDEAAKLRGNRKTSQTETTMLLAWQEKTEREVVTAMGAPNVTSAGGLRFLAYGQDFDSRYVLQNVVTGQSWANGVYKSCNIQFVLTPDAQNEYRVADVVISKFRSGDGWAPDVCGDIMRAPRG